MTRFDLEQQKKEFETQLNNFKEINYVSGHNKKLIVSFIEDRLATGSVDYNRSKKYLTNLKILAFFLKKELDKLTEQDIKKFMFEYKSKFLSNDLPENIKKLKGKSKKYKGKSKKYKGKSKKYIREFKGSPGAWTQRDARLSIKYFLKFIKSDINTDWLNSKVKRNVMNAPESILTQKEIIKLIKCCTSQRDVCFILFLFDSGVRISECMNLRIKNVEFDEDVRKGALVSVEGKTGPREVRIIDSASALRDLIEKHPFKNDPNAALWFRKNSDSKLPVTKEALANMLKRCAKRAGITKKVNPHNFRRSKASLMARGKSVSDSMMKYYFGWTKDSKMLETYVHVSAKDADEAILASRGLINKKNTESELMPVTCKKCETINPVGTSFCKKCRATLETFQFNDFLEREEEATIDELLLKAFEKNPKMKKDLIKTMKEIHGGVKDGKT